MPTISIGQLLDKPIYATKSMSSYITTKDPNKPGYILIDKAGNAIAKKYNLLVIEDTAQAPGAKYRDKFAGTLGDIGIYSLNYHKHIHSWGIVTGKQIGRAHV